MPADHVEAVFSAELEAYRIAKQDKDLSLLVPDFYGSVGIGNISDNAGADISDQFWLSCAYQMAHVKGSFVKIGSIDSEEANRVMRLFHAAGIRHVVDASVVLDVNRKVACVVDFAVEEFIL